MSSVGVEKSPGGCTDALDEPVEVNDCTVTSKKRLQAVVAIALAIAVNSGSSGAATAALVNPDFV